MNILFLTLLDFSSVHERGIYTDLLREFVNNNYSLYVVSPVEKRKNINTNLIVEKNIQILKLEIGNIQKTNVIEKGVSTLTLEKKIINGIKKFFSDVKFDLILYSTPPITFYNAIKFVKNRDNAKTYLLLKDIFPQNAVDIGLLSKKGFKGLIYKYFRKKEKKLYKISDYIGCMSEANVSFIINHNTDLDANKVEICPNSIEPAYINIDEKEKVNIKIKYGIPLDKTVFIYGGNLGKPQGIDFLMECIKINELNQQSFFVIVGSGTEFTRLNKFFKENNFYNSILIQYLDKKDYNLLVRACDIGLIFLDNRFTIPNFPSRILSYMEASMPVLAATDVNTDVGDVIIKSQFGYWCESRDVYEYNSLLNKLCDTALIKQLGKNARKYLEENYDVKKTYDIIIRHFY